MANTEGVECDKTNMKFHNFSLKIHSTDPKSADSSLRTFVGCPSSTDREDTRRGLIGDRGGLCNVWRPVRRLHVTVGTRYAVYCAVKTIAKHAHVHPRGLCVRIYEIIRYLSWGAGASADLRFSKKTKKLVERLFIFFFIFFSFDLFFHAESPEPIYKLHRQLHNTLYS